MIRKCLKCRQPFKSQHNGNRLCGKCNIDNTRWGRIDMSEGGGHKGSSGRGRVLRKRSDGGSQV